MRIHGLVVARNEADRYLELSLKLLKAQVDSLFFYDDRSSDETTEIAAQYTSHVYVRPIDRPSFLDNEGLFRQDAWDLYQGELEPDENTWVISVDADELLVGRCLLTACRQPGMCTAVNVPIPEVFGWQDGPLVRTDGFWGGLKAPRLFRWRPDGAYPDQPMACGSAPSYARQGPFLEDTGVTLLHCGYLREWDRMAKYARYSAISHGHNSVHISSILQPDMTLEKWIGPYPRELDELALHQPHMKKSSC